MWGQLGIGNQTPSNKFVAVKGLPPDVVAVQAGGSTSGAICDSGRIYLWGRNDWGMLGLGNTTSKWLPTLMKGMVAVHPGERPKHLQLGCQHAGQRLVLLSQCVDH